MQTTKQQQPHSLFRDRTTAFAFLHPVDVSEEHVDGLISLLKQSRQSARRLIEFPGILMPSFRPTLEALQKMSVLNELPFA